MIALHRIWKSEKYAAVNSYKWRPGLRIYTHLLQRLRIGDNIQGSPQKSPSFCLPPKQLSMSGWGRDDGILILQGVLVPLYPALSPRHSDGLTQRARPHDNSLPVSVVLQSSARQQHLLNHRHKCWNIHTFRKLIGKQWRGQFCARPLCFLQHLYQLTVSDNINI